MADLNRLPSMGSGGIHINTTHSDHEKFSMALGCFIGVLVLLVLIVILLGVSAHRQGVMLNNSNSAMAQINNLKKAVVGSKTLGRLAPNMQANRQAKQHFAGNRVNVNGNLGSKISPAFYGGQTASSMPQLNTMFDQINVGAGPCGGSYGSNGSCGSGDAYTAYTSSTGGNTSSSSSTSSSANQESQNALAFFKEIGTIGEEVHVGGGMGGGGMRSAMGNRRAGMM